MIKIYAVKGMSCVICKGNVEKALKSLSGVNNAIVSLMDNEVSIDYDEKLVNEAELFKVIKDAGYQLQNTQNRKSSKDFIKIIISFVLMAILMFVAMSNFLSSLISIVIQTILCLCIIGLNIEHYLSGFKALFKLLPNMDSLVSISSVVSFAYSIFASIMIIKGKDYNLYFETSAMVLVIVSIGAYVENLNKSKTTKFIRGLSTLIPMQANLLVDNKTTIIPIEELRKGDYILIKPGESIPQDSIVVSGYSSVDESLITGESMPVNKTTNNELIGGTINIDGTLIAQVSKNANLTTLSTIISSTKQAAISKIPVERFADVISKYFVFGVIGVSLLTLVFWLIMSKDIELALNFSLSVLVISCPCALGLATPSAVYVACSSAASNGVLIKNPEVLETTGKIKTMIFDKTGTLTNNQMSIVKVESFDDSFIDVLSSLESNSNHPIAKAICAKFGTGELVFDAVSQVSALGIEACIDEDIYFAGNQALLNKHGINFVLKDSLTVIGVGKNDELLGLVYLDSQIKAEAQSTIAKLKQIGINTVMATGDNENVAFRTAKILSFDRYAGNVNPQDKQELVQECKKFGITAMVGDGINDAVALSSADIGIGLNSGTDIANATSDITLINNNLKDIIYFINLSKKTMKIIKDNLYWALCYNAIFIPVAAGALYNSFNFCLNPMIGSISMTISSIIVISNALRIAKVSKED